MLPVSIAAFFISLLLCGLFVRLGAAGVMLDSPNERSLHVTPTPRTGGIGIAAGLVPAVVVVFPSSDLQMRSIIAGWLLVFGISLLDDVRDVAAPVRLLVHAIAAGMVVIAAPATLEPLAAVVALFWIVWGTNLFNFMDGMDGLAATMAIIGGAALAVALGGPAALLLVAAVSATLAFLCFNRPPAKIFMGDAGSASLGFLFAASSVSAVSSGALPGWLPLLVFLPFITDATFTLLYRAWQKKRVWQAHREHVYQALVLAGWPVSRSLLAFATAMLLCGVLALGLQEQGTLGWWALTGVAGLFLSLYWYIMGRWAQKKFLGRNQRGAKQ